MAPTATASTEDTAAAVAPVTFISISANQVLVRRPERFVDNGMGGKVRQNFEDWLEAQRKQNHERELSHLEPLPIDETPWKVEFENHVFDTSDPKLIEWLRGRDTFNVVGPSGFYEQGAAPDEPRPTLAEQAVKIARASAEADVDAINDVLRLEKDTHNRVPIIQAAEAALRSFAEGSEPDSGSATGDPSSNPG